MKTAQLKTKITQETRAELEAIAQAREMSLADIAREALREYLDRRRPPILSQPIAGLGIFRNTDQSQG